MAAVYLAPLCLSCASPMAKDSIAPVSPFRKEGLLQNPFLSCFGGSEGWGVRIPWALPAISVTKRRRRRRSGGSSGEVFCLFYDARGTKYWTEMWSSIKSSSRNVSQKKKKGNRAVYIFLDTRSHELGSIPWFNFHIFLRPSLHVVGMILFWPAIYLLLWSFGHHGVDLAGWYTV
uniref:Uncharacterized protein LOC105051944 isoform X2 n=1 Tax=Elaeis guineensis var. tenera TaxID=51953 RepID=A0A8N4F795_ELAGV|nr:uncharacterized protein LOC105051944 isoform X2 [Elaeis guineensis]